LVKKKKFDLRQWVLVTDWNPLTIWVYEEPYVRFAASDFSLNNIGNKYAHLSNNTVNKYAVGVDSTYDIPGNMWSLDELTAHLKEEYGRDVWADMDLNKKIKELVTNTLISGQDMFDQSLKGGGNGKPFEIFGLDIMLDCSFNTWLLEVNSSPAMDYSTPITTRLVKLVLEDTIKVVVDYAEAPKKQRKNIDTGMWTLVYQAK
jgi:tubulin monoglycylase TTLL3/8